MPQDHIFGLLLVFIPTIPSLVALIVGLFNHQSVQKLNTGVNGRLTELVNEAQQAAYERGRTDGYAQAKAELAAQPTPCQNYIPVSTLVNKS